MCHNFSGEPEIGRKNYLNTENSGGTKSRGSNFNFFRHVQQAIFPEPAVTSFSRKESIIAKTNKKLSG